jgi:hypothetical protein
VGRAPEIRVRCKELTPRADRLRVLLSAIQVVTISATTVSSTDGRAAEHDGLD